MILKQAEKEKLTISQAFLIDYLVPTINKKSKHSIYQPIFLYYYNKENLQINIIRFIIKYFNSIKQLLPEQWINPSGSILLRTVSIGAFLRTLHFLFVVLLFDEFNGDPNAISKIESTCFEKNLKGIEGIDFGRSGKFGGTSSAGSLNKLKEEIIEKAAFSKNVGYSNFLGNFKHHYLPRFSQWLSNNT